MAWCGTSRVSNCGKLITTIFHRKRCCKPRQSRVNHRGVSSQELYGCCIQRFLSTLQLWYFAWMQNAKHVLNSSWSKRETRWCASWWDRYYWSRGWCRRVGGAFSSRSHFEERARVETLMLTNQVSGVDWRLHESRVWGASNQTWIILEGKFCQDKVACSWAKGLLDSWCCDTRRSNCYCCPLSHVTGFDLVEKWFVRCLELNFVCVSVGIEGNIIYTGSVGNNECVMQSKHGDYALFRMWHFYSAALFVDG